MHLAISNPARTMALRVVGSTRASIATIAAAVGDGFVGGENLDGIVLAQAAATCCATVKSTYAASSIPCSVVSCGPFVQVLTGVNVGDADACAKRRANRLARDDRLRCARPAPARRRARRARCPAPLRTRPALRHALHAREQRLGEIGLGLVRPELSLLDGDVEGNEHVPGFDDLAGHERTTRTVPGTSLRSVIERRATTVPIDVVVLRVRVPARSATTDSIGSG